MDKTTYTIAEALEALPFSRATLYRLAAAGEVEIRRIGGKSFIPGESLRSLLNNARPYHRGFDSRRRSGGKRGAA